ncbi:MAG: tetratricopeptide repeat protein [Anaerolineae bacterium]|nr:tetratricopeptide repeat protein [Anaerolineae bacterium]
MNTQTRSYTRRGLVIGELIIVFAALTACAPLVTAPSPETTEAFHDLSKPLPDPTPSPTPSAAALRDEGLAYLRAGDVEAAESALQAALALWPEEAGIHYLLGVLHIEQSDFGAAAETLEGAVALDTTNSEAFLNLGEAYRALGNLEEAAEALAEARDIDPTNPRVYYQLGLVYREQGAFGPAIEAFEQYLSMVPDGAPDQAAATGAVEELKDDVNGEWVSVTNEAASFGLLHPRSWMYVEEGPRLILAQYNTHLAGAVAETPTVVFEMLPADRLRADLGIASLEDPAEVVLAAANALGTPAGQVQTADFDGYPAALVELSADVRGSRFYGILAVVLLEDHVLRVAGAGPARQWPEVRPICIDMVNSVFFTE